MPPKGAKRKQSAKANVQNAPQVKTPPRRRGAPGGKELRTCSGVLYSELRPQSLFLMGPLKGSFKGPFFDAHKARKNGQYRPLSFAFWGPYFLNQPWRSSLACQTTWIATLTSPVTRGMTRATIPPMKMVTSVLAWVSSSTGIGSPLPGSHICAVPLCSRKSGGGDGWSLLLPINVA